MMQIDKKHNSRVYFKADYVYSLLFLLFFLFAFAGLIKLSPLFSSAVLSGIEFSLSVIIPSVFPFMILADLFIYVLHFENSEVIKRLFSRLFNINGIAVTAFLIGIISGFPIGAKLARELYISGKISKSECERLIAISSNASPAFVISGVGFSLLLSFRLGAFLYIISVLSSILSGFIFSRKEIASSTSFTRQNQKFSLVDSIKNATLACVAICGFISFFGIITALLEEFIKNDVISACLSSFFEIGNATRLISGLPLSKVLKLPLISFAISFSGLSVHFQTKSLLSGTDISMNRYYIMKLLSGLIAYLLTLFSLILFVK